jgi:hypothetical protein
MATVLFLREGDAPNRAKGVGNIFIKDAINHFGSYEKIYSLDPPIVGIQTPFTEYSNFRYVVVRVDADEVCPAFSAPGHYLLKDLSVTTAMSLLDVDNK